MADYWVLLADSDNCLSFRAKNGEESKIIAVEPADGADSKEVKVTTGEYGTELVANHVEINKCVTVQSSLLVLPDQPDATSFCRVLEGIMRGHGFTFNLRGIPSTSTPVTATKGKRRKVAPAISGFPNQVEVIRNLHPELSKVGENTPLNPKIKMWRKQAAAALGIPENEYGKFGGWYKEAISVACYSKRCYKEARTIMLELESTRQKVNGYVFEQCCGLKDELGLYRLLHRMAQGELSKEEFRETAKQEKAAYEDIQDDSGWKRKVQALEKENRKLKEELERLKSTQGSKQQQNPAEPQRQPVSQPDAGNQHMRDGDAIDERDENRTFDFDVEEEATMVTIPPPKKRQKRTASYKVSYKPPSDTSEVLDDSDGDPQWARKKDEKTSSSESDEESIMNTGFRDDTESPAIEIVVNSNYVSPVKTSIQLDESCEAVPVVGLRGVYEVDNEIRGEGITVKLPTVNNTEEREDFTTDMCRRGRDRTQKNDMLNVGDHVKALFKNGGKREDNWSDWCTGVVTSVMLNGQLYWIEFTDGAKRCLRRADIRKE